MCIRDSDRLEALFQQRIGIEFEQRDVGPVRAAFADMDQRCLLYTSDAADERSSVDLGGRRIIKKKKQER